MFRLSKPRKKNNKNYISSSVQLDSWLAAAVLNNALNNNNNNNKLIYFSLTH